MLPISFLFYRIAHFQPFQLMKIDDIIGDISTRVGISHEQSQSAFMASLEYIKGKLPDSIGSQLTGLLDGKEFDFKIILKDQAEEKLTDLKQDAQEAFDNLKEKGKDLWGKLT